MGVLTWIGGGLLSAGEDWVTRFVLRMGCRGGWSAIRPKMSEDYVSSSFQKDSDFSQQVSLNSFKSL